MGLAHLKGYERQKAQAQLEDWVPPEVVVHWAEEVSGPVRGDQHLPWKNQSIVKWQIALSYSTQSQNMEERLDNES